MNATIFSPGTRLLLPLAAALLFSLLPLRAQAQDAGACNRALQMARTEFDQGYFDRSSQRLYVCLGRGEFNAEQEREAFLLLGMIHYANLQIDEARDSLRSLLSRDPSVELNPQEYKPGFVDLFSEVRSELQPPAPPPTRAMPHRSGFWISAGIGPGGNELTCRACNVLPENDPWRGGSSGSFALSMGGVVSDRVLIGGEINHWGRQTTDSPRTAAINSIAAIMRFYPVAAGDFFLKSGIGIGGMRLEGDALSIENGGFSMQVGLGYDLRLGKQRRFALTGFGNALVVFAEGGEGRISSGAVARIDGVAVVGPANPGFVQLGIAATWF